MVLRGDMTVLYVLIGLLGASVVANLFQFLNKYRSKASLTNLEYKTIRALQNAKREVEKSDTGKSDPSANDLTDFMRDFSSSGEIKPILKILNQRGLVYSYPNPGGSGEFWRLNKKKVDL